MLKLTGIPAAGGIVTGKVEVVDRRRITVPKRHIARDEVDGEVARFARALESTDEQLRFA